MKLTRLLVVVAVVVTGVGEVVAGEINNPVITIKPVQNRDGSFDSVWTGSSFFDPLPEYMKATRLTVKCVTRIDREEDVVFWCNHPSNVQSLLELEPSKVQVPGPFRAGDTIRAEFTIKPLRVGVCNFGIVAVTVPPGGGLQMSRFVGKADANFVIGPDGTVTMMQATTIDYRYSSDLGPMPDVFEEHGAVFFIDPPPNFERMDSAATSHFWSNPYHIFHAVVWVSASTEKPSSLDLRISVSPYRDYPGGIGLDISHTDGLQVTNLTPSIPGPIQGGRDYEFSLSVNYAEADIHALSLFLATRNPAFGAPGDRQLMSLNKTTGSQVTLRIGAGSDGRLLFVTDVPPGASLESRTLVAAESIDPRYEFVRSLDQTLRYDRKTTSPGFEEALGLGSEKQERKKEPRPRRERPKPQPRRSGP